MFERQHIVIKKHKTKKNIIIKTRIFVKKDLSQWIFFQRKFTWMSKDFKEFPRPTKNLFIPFTHHRCIVTICKTHKLNKNIN